MKLFQIALFTMLLAAASVAVGQTSPGDLVVDVPFAFQVAKQTLPAGHYTVKRVDDGQIRLVNSEAQGLYVSTHAALRSTNYGSKLVFHRYGDTYFLSAVFVTGKTTGRELSRSRAERELADRKAEMELAEVGPTK